MNVQGRHYRTIWLNELGALQIIDQRMLPFRFLIEELRTVEEVAKAIRDMHVRGAGCIGATAGYGMFLAAKEAARNGRPLREYARQLLETRPTAVNLRWAVDRQLAALESMEETEARVARSREIAQAIADEDAEACAAIGRHGVTLLEELAAQNPGRPVNVLTHCNAGWLAFVDHGSATAPIYEAQRRGLPVHVWVDETRPRNQGARLTAWELGQEGLPHTIISDNSGGLLMQMGLVDLVITGADRVARNGDVANKIGTYLKALAARDNGLPFYVAFPQSTLDWEMANGMDIPIEQRGAEELTHMTGWDDTLDEERHVRVAAWDSPARNDAFDITPARLISGYLTERGLLRAEDLAALGD